MIKLKVSRFLILSFVLLMVVFIGKSASAIMLTPNDFMDIKFYLQKPTPLNADVLSFAFHGIQIESNGFLTASLFDGDTLLGTYMDPTSGFTRMLSFVAPGSQYTFLNPTVIDFTSIHDGTIDGMLRLATTTGELDINPFFSDFYVGVSTSKHSFFSHKDWIPVISEVSLSPKVIPEPISFILLLTGIAGLACEGYLRKKHLIK